MEWKHFTTEEIDETLIRNKFNWKLSYENIYFVLFFPLRVDDPQHMSPLTINSVNINNSFWLNFIAHLSPCLNNFAPCSANKTSRWLKPNKPQIFFGGAYARARRYFFCLMCKSHQSHLHRLDAIDFISENIDSRSVRLVPVCFGDWTCWLRARASVWGSDI